LRYILRSLFSMYRPPPISEDFSSEKYHGG
jgi:hypothetical protein